jgi:uncharacterized protein YejL (UPF0352 family)
MGKVMGIMNKLFELLAVLNKDGAFALISDIEAVLTKHQAAAPPQK